MLTDCLQHQLGSKKSSNDRAPDFHAQVLPPGSAPADSTHQPNPIHAIPSQANNDNVLRSHGKEGRYTGAMDAYPGATSGSVHRSMGKPLVSETSGEQRHDGSTKGRKRQTAGYEMVGMAGKPSHADQSIGDKQIVDERHLKDQRGIDREEVDVKGGKRGDKGALTASELRNVPAEMVAKEAPRSP